MRVFSMRRFRLRALVFVASFLTMAAAGTAAASACVWEANPGAGNILRVFAQPSTSSQVTGSMGDGREFFGACSASNGWIAVSAGNWSWEWTGNPPYNYVRAEYAIKLS